MSTHLKMAVAIAATESNREAINHDRRKLLAGAGMGLAAAGAASLFPIHSAPAATNDAIRPFRINVPEEALVDLRRRLAATRWPEKETVDDDSQGVPLATIQELVRYWQTEYDWRKVEARLNAVPQFITEIDGLDIHFIHVRSKHDNALPLIVTHGWPGSVIEQLKIIDPLTNPTAHGGSASDAFHLVIPSIPGYGFSGKPTTIGWDPVRIARAWIVLMKRLGYTKFAAQGGDWGAPITNEMARLAAPELLGIHVNLPGVVPPEIVKALQSGNPAPSGLSADEQQPSSSSSFSLPSDAPTRRSWGRVRKRCRDWRIRLPALPPGCSTTATAMPSRRRRSPRPCAVARSTDTPQATLRGMMCSTTSRSTG